MTYLSGLEINKFIKACQSTAKVRWLKVVVGFFFPFFLIELSVIYGSLSLFLFLMSLLRTQKWPPSLKFVIFNRKELLHSSSFGSLSQLQLSSS